MIKDKVAKGLITQNPRNTTFLYKVQNQSKEGIPGRPVISSVNCHSSKISEYGDYQVQPIVREISSYIKDTSGFLRKLKPIAEVPKNPYLVTLDVNTSITVHKHPKLRRDKSSKNIP